LALAREDKIATTWTRLTVVGDLLAATDHFLSLVVQSVDKVEPDQDTRIRAKSAGVDAAHDELPANREMIRV
jgi:hypothetical protein